MPVADDLRATLAICRQELGAAEAHPIHIARLRLIWIIVQEACQANPDHWQAALDRAERIVDMEQAK